MTKNINNNSAVSRVLGGDPEVIAKHAIRLLEKDIYEKYGVKVRMGAELEFTVTPNNLATHQEAIEIDDGYGLKSTHGHLPAINRPAERVATFHSINGDIHLQDLRDPLFPNSSVVSFSYNEIPKNQIEAVISHKARHDTLPPDGSRAITFARSIEALKRTIESSNSPSRKFANDPNHDKAIRHLGRNWKTHFDSYMVALPSSQERCNGMHINFSLVDAVGNKTTTREYDKDSAICNGVKNVVQEGTFLLIGDDSATQRLKSRRCISALKQRCEGENVYYELMTASANSNPYYATMLTLVGIKNALEKGEYDTKRKHFCAEVSPEVSKAEKLEDFEAQFFTGKRRIFEVLDQLESGLGKRFECAVKAHPPLEASANAVAIFQR